MSGSAIGPHRFFLLLVEEAELGEGDWDGECDDTVRCCNDAGRDGKFSGPQRSERRLDI